MATDEEARAAAWRQQVRNRAEFVRQNEKRLRGSQSARNALELAWAPVINRTKDEPEEESEQR